ncbi:hypothetical protein OS175_02690 [Marinicella sp. S1101]|uniref:hypothetical protein n=1 Tax=Marinicella marina TaxID=2996016 RepID=UPI002260BFC3|nr:hypothetical protein [Marinicella marina]MCX7552774.1 hypothetical protein [Marinicella marina]MDJ1139917.1 hypothetical protein [Marinicella marina]
MKTAFLLIILMFISLAAVANDVSCQSDLMKPKLNNTMTLTEAEKPAQLTVSDTQKRLKENRSKDIEKSKTENTISATEEEPTVKKESSLGNIFDILLPAKLRNPVK